MRALLIAAIRLREILKLDSYAPRHVSFASDGLSDITDKLLPGYTYTIPTMVGLQYVPGYRSGFTTYTGREATPEGMIWLDSAQVRGLGREGGVL